MKEKTEEFYSIVCTLSDEEKRKISSELKCVVDYYEKDIDKFEIETLDRFENQLSVEIKKLIK